MTPTSTSSAAPAPASGPTAGAAQGPASVQIDRLTLAAGPMSEAEGRRLAELVGQALHRLPVGAPVPSGRLDVTVDVAAAASVEVTARAVVAAIEAALRTDGAS